MLIDEVRITIKAGDGGDGLVHFYSDRWRPKGGPDGGNGGRGGSIYFRAVNDITRLHQFRHQTTFKASPGQSGGPNQRSGKNGPDLVLDIPVGTLIIYDNGSQLELTQVGQLELIAKGGRGGLGNFHFRSSTNQTPQNSKPGQKTTPRNLFLQLKLIADVGLIGLPNAGKTSLLNELTAASAKVANYPFTTLEPNLGVIPNGAIVADIPGLIEGASQGKGLGVKFLKHIERTRLLLHCISLESADPEHDYCVIRQELANYSSKLSSKPEIVVFTKSDLASTIPSRPRPDIVVSIVDSDSIRQLFQLISSKLS